MSVKEHVAIVWEEVLAKLKFINMRLNWDSNGMAQSALELYSNCGITECIYYFFFYFILCNINDFTVLLIVAFCHIALVKQYKFPTVLFE